MQRIESGEDMMRGIVRYQLDDGRQVCLDAGAVREFGAVKLLQHYGYAKPETGKRLPVIQENRAVGYLPADFDPHFIRSRTFLYEPRPGDFRREGDRWIADRMLGPGDLEAVPGFQPA